MKPVKEIETMEKTYQPEQIESACYARWESQGYFAPSTPRGQGNPFCMVIPPPNITGSLHMGHGFGTTLMDIMVRYHRMQGGPTLWQPGTDHAGIATQMVVERQLQAEGKSRHDLGRDAFIQRIWDWKAISGGTISRQFRRLGASLDWQRERFTLDSGLSQAVTEVFIRLYQEGLIYRGKRLVNWDPVLLTAISDLEVINQEMDGHLWYIRYPLAGESGHLTVATTRPETMLGDMAVAVHPEDERYRAYIGKLIMLPLTERTIPIIADESIDPSFGSGCVKITPAHDFADYALGIKHQLPMLTIFTPDAHLNDEVPPPYRGLERLVARKKIIHDLENVHLLEKTVPHRLKVPLGEKSGAIIEPYLTPQWFVRMQPLAEPAIRAVERGDIRFIPEQWTKTYFQWLQHIEDWCISRQLWWGHRIPVWYDDHEHYYVGTDEKAVRAHYKLGPDIILRQDEDVLDTWFSSALWPFSSLGWPEDTETLATFYPTQLLVTGFDILFFWVARMVMMGLKFTGQVPFKEVYITGLIRDHEGQKMSKSKGNVLDPLDLIDGISLDALIKKRTSGLMQPQMAQKIEKATRQQFPEGIAAFGTDALRFTFCALASFNREIRFDLGRLEGYRNFCNKLWNAARYVLLSVEHHPSKAPSHFHDLALADRWILSELQTTIAKAQQALADYRFDVFANALYEFTWNNFCDWYLELTKPMLAAEGENNAAAWTRHTLLTVTETLLRLLHPIIPFITETIWQRIAQHLSIAGDTIMLQPYPRYDANLYDETSVANITWLKDIVIAIRTLRSERDIAPSKALNVLFRKGNAWDRTALSTQQPLLMALAKVTEVAWLADDEGYPKEALTTVVRELEIIVPLEGLIDKKAESARLHKAIQQLKQDIERVERKLDNPQFIERAPRDVVAKEQERLVALHHQLTPLEAQWQRLQKEKT